jgi:hypothetical protein
MMVHIISWKIRNIQSFDNYSLKLKMGFLESKVLRTTIKVDEEYPILGLDHVTTLKVCGV